MSKLGAKFWIGSDLSDQSMRAYTSSGSIGIPQFYLVDSKGKVVSSELPTEAVIEELLANIVDLRLERKLDVVLKDAELAYRRGFLGQAFKATRAFTSHQSAAVVKDVDYLCKMVEKADRHRRKESATDLKGLSVSETYGRLLVWKYDYHGLPFGDWAAKELTTFKKDRAKMKDKKLKTEMRVWAKLEAVLRREPKASRSAYELKRVKQIYSELADEFRRTEPGRVAKRRLAVWGA